MSIYITLVTMAVVGTILVAPWQSPRLTASRLVGAAFLFLTGGAAALKEVAGLKYAMELASIGVLLGAACSFLIHRRFLGAAPGSSHGERIELTDPKDLAFAQIAQGARVNDTVLPSGYRTPPRDLFIQGECLVGAPSS